MDQSRYIEVWPQWSNQALHLQAGNPRLPQLIGENAGRSGDHGDFMAKTAQLERKLAHMALRAANHVAAGEHVNNPHARPRLSFALSSSDDGTKVSLDGRPYQAESIFQRLRHSATSALVGACAA